MITTRLATLADEQAVNLLAKQSPFTRDFANPPMSLKVTRAVAFQQNEVHVAVEQFRRGGVKTEVIVGFVWSRPMKAKHMPFSTVYYIGVHPQATRRNIAYNLMGCALRASPFGAVELVCEHGNIPGTKFFRSLKAKAVREGTVGKDERPYTRWRIER